MERRIRGILSRITNSISVLQARLKLQQTARKGRDMATIIEEALRDLQDEVPQLQDEKLSLEAQLLKIGEAIRRLQDEKSDITLRLLSIGLKAPTARLKEQEQRCMERMREIDGEIKPLKAQQRRVQEKLAAKLEGE